MNSKTLLYSINRNDECYTPRYAVEPIIKYIDKTKIIWCPFDTEKKRVCKGVKRKWIYSDF